MPRPSRSAAKDGVLPNLKIRCTNSLHVVSCVQLRSGRFAIANPQFISVCFELPRQATADVSYRCDYPGKRSAGKSKSGLKTYCPEKLHAKSACCPGCAASLVRIFN